MVIKPGLNRSFCQSFGVTAEENENRLVYELGNGQWNIPGLKTLLEVLPRDQSFCELGVERDFENIGRCRMRLNGRKIWREDSHSELILLAFEDITTPRRTEVGLETSSTAASGIDAARNGRAVLMLDIGLPGMDGYEVARRMREDICPGAVIIAVSGYGDEDAHRRTKATGFDHHFVKPVE
jgi:CheY-like chemotaxis protein